MTHELYELERKQIYLQKRDFLGGESKKKKKSRKWGRTQKSRMKGTEYIILG